MCICGGIKLDPPLQCVEWREGKKSREIMALKVEKLRLLPQSKSYIHAWLYCHRITTCMKLLGLMKDALCVAL